MFLESRLVVNTSSWRQGLRLNEWVLRSGKIEGWFAVFRAAVRRADYFRLGCKRTIGA